MKPWHANYEMDFNRSLFWFTHKYTLFLHLLFCSLVNVMCEYTRLPAMLLRGKGKKSVFLIFFLCMGYIDLHFDFYLNLVLFTFLNILIISSKFMFLRKSRICQCCCTLIIQGKDTTFCSFFYSLFMRMTLILRYKLSFFTVILQRTFLPDV